MEQTRIKISVSQKSAIAAGRTSYGDQIVTLSDADVVSLTAEEREEILQLPTDSNRELGAWRYTQVTTDSDGLAGVREALQFRRAERARKAATETATRTALIADVLAAAREDLIQSKGYVSDYIHSDRIPWDAPELAALKSDLDREVARRLRVTADEALVDMRSDPTVMPSESLTETYSNRVRDRLTDAERREVDDRKTAVLAAKKAASEAHVESARAQMRDWALAGRAGPDAQRAAEGGYDVTTAVIDSIEDALPEYDRKDWGRPDWEWSERKSPNSAALDLAEKITKALQEIEHPECISLEVTRVQRIEHNSKDITRTGVVVTMTCPLDIDDRYYLYFSDPEPETDDQDEE